MAIASPVGEIILYTEPAGSVVGEQELIVGWLLCNGQSVSKATYPDLWDMFSQGGTVPSPWDSVADPATFKLPNLVAKMALGVSGSHALASTGGAETVVLTTANIPAHTHSPGSTSSVGGHVHSASIATTAPSNNHVHTSNYLYTTQFETAPSGGTLRDLWHYGEADSNLDIAEFLSDELTSDEVTAHTHSWTSATQANHNHTVTLNNAGSATAHNNLPPYITLAFLIKY